MSCAVAAAEPAPTAQPEPVAAAEPQAAAASAPTAAARPKLPKGVTGLYSGQPVELDLIDLKKTKKFQAVGSIVGIIEIDVGPTWAADGAMERLTAEASERTS